MERLLRPENRADLKRVLLHHVVDGRVYADAAVQSIYAGSNEIMKVIIARRLGLE